ncbi:MAG: cysteine desulfurase NifS [Oscillospiraceae bacterium]|jgi:cysteine desulfurase|nr:cysteine desulfurase NifS [Oscillospiraceae bacterium]
MGRFVYADNAATTRISDSVFQAMVPFLTEKYGNASSLYGLGRDSRRAIEAAREKTAKALGAEPREIYFTSCGSESDNWAIKSTALAMAQKGKKHIITTVFEHHAVLHTCQALERQGFEVTYLPVEPNGVVDIEKVKEAVRPDTALVTIMYANNEIGTIQPIPEIGALCQEKGVLFHTDAVQAVGAVPIDVKAQNIDLLSLSAHKFHGPKGIGALYIRKGLVIPNLVDGGGQERGRRAGTENNAYIVGLGTAIETACASIEEKNTRVSAMRDKLIAQLLQIPHTRLNGDPIKRLPGNVNISFEGVEGESLLLMLDSRGICGSSGSACTSGSLDPSHVLLALGLKHETAHGSLRLSLSGENTMEDVDYILEQLPPIVQRLRDMSPVWEKMMKEEQN